MRHATRPTFTLLFVFAASALLRPDPAVAQNAPKYTGVGACNQALKLLDQNKPAEALDVLNAAKDTMDADDMWLWWGNSGLCHRDLRQDEEALKCYSEAVKLKPDCWFVVRHAELLHLFGRDEEALKELDADAEQHTPDQRAIELR